MYRWIGLYNSYLKGMKYSVLILLFISFLQLEAEVLARLFHHQITTILPITLNIHLPMEAIVMEVQGVC